MFEKSKVDLLFMNGEHSAAAEAYYEGAREGDAQAAFSYGYCLMTGKGVKKDYAEAKSFFSFAREADCGEAHYNIAMLYFEGGFGLPRDYLKARENLEASASKGCLEAQLYLGMAYTSGCMFSPDIVRITMIPTHIPEYRQEAFYLEGDIEDFERDEDERYKAISQDANMAFSYFQDASRHTDTPFLNDLIAKGKFLYARCFVDGLGTDFDRDKSVRLMFLAERAGSEDAKIYIAENGLTRDMLGRTGAKRLKGGR